MKKILLLLTILLVPLQAREPDEAHYHPNTKGMPADATWKTKEGNLTITFREDGTIIKATQPTMSITYDKQNILKTGTYKDMTFTIISRDKMIFHCKEPSTKTDLIIKLVSTPLPDHIDVYTIHYKGILNGEKVDKSHKFDEKRIMVNQSITTHYNQISEFSNNIRRIGSKYVYEETGINPDESQE